MPRRSYLTTYLWTGNGFLDKTERVFYQQKTTEDPNILDLKRKPFTGSLSKIYHSVPVLVTEYSDELWSEETPDGIVFVRAVPNQNR